SLTLGDAPDYPKTLTSECQVAWKAAPHLPPKSGTLASKKIHPEHFRACDFLFILGVENHDELVNETRHPERFAVSGILTDLSMLGVSQLKRGASIGTTTFGGFRD